MKMKTLIAVFITVALFSIAVEGFLGFGHKFKDGCNPDPCKNKGQCILDKINPNISTCNCSKGYYGKNCEIKGGCSQNHCRKFVSCEDDKLNPTNYTCKCQPGYVGKNCDTSDGCAKNPCKSGSKCILDAKLKPVCQCLPGWTSKNCDKRNCTIIEFKGKNFMPKPKVYVDSSIQKMFHDLDGLAKLCGAKIQPVRSFSIQTDLKSNPSSAEASFFIGRGLQMEVHDLNGKLLCNTVCLGKPAIGPKPAKCLIDGLHAIGWKSSILTPGLIHEGTFLGSLKEYNALKELKQVGCKEMKF